MAIDVRVTDLRKPDQDDGLPPTVYALTAFVQDTDHPALETRFDYSVAPFVSVPVLYSLQIKQTGDAALLPLSATVVRDLPLASWDRAARSHVEERLRGPLTLSSVVAKAMGLDVGDGDTVTIAPEGVRGDAAFRASSSLTAASEVPRGAVNLVATSSLTASASVSTERVASGTAAARGSASAQHVAKPPTAEDYKRLGPEGVVSALNPGLSDSQAPLDIRRFSTLLRMAEVAARYHENTLAGAHNPTAATARQMGLTVPTARALVHRARVAQLLPPAPPQKVSLAEWATTPPDGILHRAGRGEPIDD